MQIPAAGTYNISVNASATADASAFTVEVGNQKLDGKATSTGDWEKFQNFKLGKAEIKEAGLVELKVRPSAQGWHAINLRDVRLDPAK